MHRSIARLQSVVMQKEAGAEKRPGRGVRVLFGLAGAFDFLTGMVLLTTLGLRGFAGTAG